MRVRSAIAPSVLLALAALVLPGAASAAYPGANGQIAFTSTQDGGGRHIFVTAPTGIVDLTGPTAHAMEIQPKFSPDGREILFTRGGQGLPNTEIFVMAADGTGRTALTNTTTGNTDATWSPDGTQIAFVSERDHGIGQIFIMRSDGTGVREITHDADSKSELAWSPRGDRILFVHGPARGGDKEIYSIRTDGTGVTDLTNDPSHFDEMPAWSPDGSQIVYQGPLHPGQSVGADLWIMNPDGTGQRWFSHQKDYSDGGYPAWSPDGSTIAFTANNGSGYYHVWSAPAAGGENGELIANKVGNPLDWEVDWQPRPTGAVPATRIMSARIRKRAATFSFAATGPATGYTCGLRVGKQKATFKRCLGPTSYKHLKPGAYTFSVVAFGPGEPYRAPATRRFKIKP